MNFSYHNWKNSPLKIFNSKLFNLNFEGDRRKFLWVNFFKQCLCSSKQKPPDNESDRYATTVNASTV